MMRGVAILIVWLIAIAALAASEHQRVNAGAPVVQADYQRCFAIHNGPIRRPDGYNVKPNRKNWSTA